MTRESCAQVIIFQGKTWRETKRGESRKGEMMRPRKPKPGELPEIPREPSRSARIAEWADQALESFFENEVVNAVYNVGVLVFVVGGSMLSVLLAICFLILAISEIVG